VCRVQPDLPAVARAFDYLVPEDVAGIVRVGTIVRVPLHGRRVRGWVVADDVEPEAPRSELRPLAKAVSAGPPAEVVELCRWAAWRYAGPLRCCSGRRHPNVVPPSADPEIHTAVFPPRGARRIDAAAVDALVTRIAACSRATEREWHDVVGTLIANEASTIVVAPTRAGARARRRPPAMRPGSDRGARERAGRADRELEPARPARPSSWAEGRSARPRSGLAAVLVLDDGDEALKEERAPTWNARDLARTPGGPAPGARW
jgi:primosomal protein N' (replication factor Y)